MSMIEDDSVGAEEMIVHPAFDPVSCLWFLETGEEAKTISDLKKQLPSNVKIVGYFPNGYDGLVRVNKCRVEPRESTQNYNPLSKANVPKVISAKRSGIRLHPVREMPKRPKAKRVASNRKYDYEAILNLWAKGMTGPQIAGELNIEDWKKVCQVVSIARKDGDPRAVSRKPY